MTHQPDEPHRFKPEMPSIPGVNTAPIRRNLFSTLSPVARTILVISPLFILAAIISWAVLRPSRTSPRVSHPLPAELELPSPATADNMTRSPEGVAAIRDLATPWSSKTFDFRKGSTGENIPSILIRLPGAPTARGSYWAFALHEPFGHCQLEYITALQKLSTDYGFRATHPMVADPCSRTVFDPLQMANLPGGAWARGAIVQGSAFRPPLGIEIRIVGDQLVAAQIE
jgi:hypothetical protein